MQCLQWLLPLFDRCFNIGVAAGLVAEAAKAVGTFLPGCQDKDVVLFFFFDW